MATLIVSNQRTEEMVGDLTALAPEYRKYIANQAHRMVWSARQGDVIVLPSAPDRAFLDYAGEQLGFELTVVVPPPGRLGYDVLSRERLADPEFVASLKELVEARGIDDVLPFHFDSAVVALTHELGLESRTPGFGFVDQGGGTLINSKATFRAFAGGTGIAVPEGGVTGDLGVAEEVIWSYLAQGKSVIVKQDFHVAGFGNEIIAPVEGVRPIGAHKTEVVTDRAALAAYLAERWPWYTEQGKRPVVIEHYIPDSAPIYAEVLVTDEGVQFVGHGEMRMMPVINGLIVPAPSAGLAEFPRFLEQAETLCRPLHAMGYRGTVSIDAIVTPDEHILINEFNGRVGGSSHIHHIGERLVGGDYFTDRVLIELRRCTFPPFKETVERLADLGLAYDPTTRRGVLITVDDDSPNGGFGEYLVVAESLPAAERIEQEFADAFASA